MPFNSKPVATLTKTKPLFPTPAMALNVSRPGDTLSMPSIRDIVQQAFLVQFLSVEAEEQLRMMLRGKYEMADFQAFMKLQYAVMKGHIRQEARERIRG